MSDDISVTDSQEELLFNPKIRWVIPQRLESTTFVGRDVLAVAHDLYIVFLNFKNNTELVYLANNTTAGDGVDVIAGHRTSIFAFAEKIKHPRIFVLSYPSFAVLAEMKDTDVNRYKSLCMMENDLVAAFSGFPNYVVSVWSWRSRQRLLSVPTAVVRRKQIYVASRSHLMVCQCWGEGLIVWEVAPCYKRCLVMRRAKPESTGWEVPEPPLLDVCWTIEGQLYTIDPEANLYSVCSDGIGMVTSLEWSEELKGRNKTSMCSFGNGIMIYGPDDYIRLLKKSEKKWKVVWTHSVPDVVVRMVSNSTGDEAAVWTDAGMVFRLAADPHDEHHIQVSLFTFKQRHIKKICLIPPDYTYVATLNNTGVLCLYNIMSGNLVSMKYIEGEDISFQASPVDPLVVLFGEVGYNYGIALYSVEPTGGLRNEGSMCLTHQIVSHVAFSPTGRELVAAAMSAGHIFIMKLGVDYKLTLVRYTELGRGLADCFLMRVGEFMRCFSLVLFSDKYLIGERIICINAETGKDNKFAGKMSGPYARLVPLGARDALLAVPHLQRHYHVLKLSGEKGVTVSVKMGAIIDSGHDVKQFDGNLNLRALLTFGYCGTVIKRTPDAPEDYDFKLVVTHRYESGIRNAVIDSENKILAHLANNETMAVQTLMSSHRHAGSVRHDPIDLQTMNEATNTITIIGALDKNYLDLQEEKKVHEEAMDYKKQREEIVKNFEVIQAKLVELLEENLAEVPLHQLSLSEFNLHMEYKKERIKQAEKEREEIRLKTEARMVAQDKVTAWIRAQCWDTMLTPRTKIFAVFSHYQVENYAVLPTQRDNWPELQQVVALRDVEMDNDADLFRPWEEQQLVCTGSEIAQTREDIDDSVLSMKEHHKSAESQMLMGSAAEERAAAAAPASDVLSGSGLQRCVSAPRGQVPQTLAFSFVHMNWMYHIVKLNVQNMRLWFNKQFDELMSVKKREVGLVEERNARLRFIIEELNKLSDLRGSFHHLHIVIRDPEWRQEEQPWKLIKVEPNECSIEPYISPSQIVVAAPDPGPKDDFRERALIDMMDGVLEKLWHEEIKKPIPMPLCMLEKDPEHFNEEDLRLVFDYEAKVAFRNEERDKYRKMLHAEYAKLSTVLNEGIVKFNYKVKDMWLMKLKVDSIIGQENLNLMRLRRTNLDRVEMAEKLEDMRNQISRLESEVEMVQQEAAVIEQQSEECSSALEALAYKDRHMERTFKNHFADLSPIIVDQCYKFFKKRPKWHQRGALTGAALAELAAGVLAGVRPPLLHPDCLDYFKGVEQLDLISNMPPVMDENLWTTMCKLRRVKIENEIRMRGLAVELSGVESAGGTWARAGAARRAQLARLADCVLRHRDHVELLSRNRTIQLVLPAGQVEIITTGHMEDFEDAALILREDIDVINNVILKVGELKLRMMRKQMEFRKGILGKEWEHAQTMMKLRHMEEELYAYERLKIPKELQLYLKNRELGYTEEQDYVRMEKEMEASKVSVNKILNEQIHKYEELELKLNALEAESARLTHFISDLNVKVSEKRLNDDPLEPIRIRRTLNTRMEMLIMRSGLIREVQQKHTTIVMLQTELELLRLKTYPTLATFRTLDNA